MATQLNIKDAETVRRVRELAAARGEPVTATIRALVDKEWATREAETQKRIEESRRWLHDLQDRVQQKLTPEMRAGTLKEVLDSIYDLDGPEIFSK